MTLELCTEHWLLRENRRGPAELYVGVVDRASEPLVVDVMAIEDGTIRLSLGVHRWNGAAPVLMARGARLLVGVGAELYVISLETKEVLSQSYVGSPIRYFAIWPDSGSVTLVHELGMVGLGSGGHEEWRVDTDVVAELTLGARVARLVTLEGEVLSIEARDGSTAPVVRRERAAPGA